MFGEAAVHEFPFATAGAPARVHGKAAIRDFMAPMTDRIRFGTFSDLVVREIGDETIVEAEGHHHDAATGDPFDVRYLWIFTRRDGKVVRLRDYTGPRVARTSDT